MKAPTSRAEHWVESCNCALMEAGEDMEGGRASWDRESLCFGLDPVLDPLQYSGHSHVVPRKLRLRARKPLAQGHRARQGYQDVIHVPYHSTFQSVQFSSFFVCLFCRVLFVLFFTVFRVGQTFPLSVPVHFHTPKKELQTHSSHHPHAPSQPLELRISCLFPCICPFWTFLVNGIPHRVAFWVARYMLLKALSRTTSWGLLPRARGPQK